MTLQDAVVSAFDTAKGERELVVTLEKLPASNMISFPFESAGLQFYPQPALTEEFDMVDCLIWTPTEAQTKDGVHHCFRPEKVVDSIAVYDQFGSKVFHVYRTQLIDAKGTKTYAKMKIENSQLIIVMDEEWLAGASYPVTVDPTFGYETVGGTEDGTDVDAILGCKFTMPENGTITNISAYLKSGSGTLNVTGAGCADNAGAPSTVLDYSSAVGVTTTWSWVDFTVDYENTLGSRAFWLQLFCDGNIRFRYDSGAANQFAYESSGYSYPEVRQMSPDGYFAWVMSIHADYATGAALKTVTDSLGLSDSALRNKGLLPITDMIGLGDAMLRNKTLIMLDSVDALDFVKGNKSPLIVSDMVGLVDLVNVITGAILKIVADAVGLTDMALLNKTVIAGDVVSVLEQVFRDKASVTVADVVSAVEVVLTTRLLAIADSVSLVEVVEAGVAGAKKTKLFLVFGDLALQITGD